MNFHSCRCWFCISLVATVTITPNVAATIIVADAEAVTLSVLSTCHAIHMARSVGWLTLRRGSVKNRT